MCTTGCSPPTWWAAKCDETRMSLRRKRVKLTAAAPLLPPKPPTPHPTLEVASSPTCCTSSALQGGRGPSVQVWGIGVASMGGVRGDGVR